MPPRERRCERCSAPIIFVREVDSTRTLCLNASKVDGGTVVLLGERAQVVPSGLGRLHSLHACGGGR